eukprot:5367878-Amphidinium_carterae.1
MLQVQTGTPSRQGRRESVSRTGRRQEWWQRWCQRCVRQRLLSAAGWAATGASLDNSAQPSHRRPGQAGPARRSGQGQSGQVPEPFLEGPARFPAQPSEAFGGQGGPPKRAHCQSRVRAQHGKGRAHRGTGQAPSLAFRASPRTIRPGQPGRAGAGGTQAPPRVRASESLRRLWRRQLDLRIGPAGENQEVPVPVPARPQEDEWTQVGPGGTRIAKRRAQSPLLESQPATMYRMLSPSAETPDADMGTATPRGTGGRSPPPPTA